MKKSKFFISFFILSFAIIAISIFFPPYFFSSRDSYESLPAAFNVKPGESWSEVAFKLKGFGVIGNSRFFLILIKILGESKRLKAGSYQIDKPLSYFQIIKKLTSSDFALGKITFPEGITFEQMLALMKEHHEISNEEEIYDPKILAKRLKIKQSHPEGLFFPSTYKFTSGTTDIAILKLAHQTQKKIIQELWLKRIDGLPIKSPYEALILASIVEKETGAAQERASISEVFINRLKKRMRLQADPTVIYGMGSSFKGNLRKKDLLKDNPFNTYTRYGLPPTPIAMPGREAIKAVLNPASHGNFYFVSRGDGTHYFSKSLRQHNRAVDRYQRSK